jgi:hypothetical protein
LFGPALVFVVRNLNPSKATGLAAVAGGLLESLFSPLFWILAVLFFALFFAASRLESKPLRNPSVLGSCYRDFDAGTGSFLSLHICVDTF